MMISQYREDVSEGTPVVFHPVIFFLFSLIFGSPFFEDFSLGLLNLFYSARNARLF